MTPIAKKLYLGTNLKMYKNIKQTIDYLNGLSEVTKDISREEICLFVIPSFTSLYASSLEINQNIIKLGAQNMFWEDFGQFTGEVSPLMLKEIGVQIIEIGHSERRQHFGETDFTVNKKVIASLKHGFTSLICVGETGLDKQLNITIERLRLQLKIALNGVREEQTPNIWIAYEPVWAIGEQGVPARADYAGDIHRGLRETLWEIFPNNGGNIPLLYGGSVNHKNAVEFICQSEIDGLFIGRSAWEIWSFNSLIREVIPVWRTKIDRLYSEN
ncbi:MAG: triose-phosphate isomerase [Bacillota bacterium]